MNYGKIRPRDYVGMAVSSEKVISDMTMIAAYQLGISTVACGNRIVWDCRHCRMLAR